MSKPDIIAAYRLRGSSIRSNSVMVSRSASVRSSPRPSAVMALTDGRFYQHNAHTLSVLPLAQSIDSLFTTADAPGGLLDHLDLGDQVAGRRVPSLEVDARRLADQAATSIAPDEVLRS